MKSDIDQFMGDSGLEALLILGSAQNNPNMAYFTGRVHLTDGYLLKIRGQPPVLFHGSMEREEAAATGLSTKNLDDYGFHELLEQAGGDRLEARVLRFERIFRDYPVKGRVALYGKVESGPAFELFRRLGERISDLQFTGEPSENAVLTRARTTKDEDEIERIRQMGKITVSVVSDVAGFLGSHGVEKGVLVNKAGEVLTIGEVKRRIDLWLAMRGAQNLEGTIFAIGRDAGIPHSTGQQDQPVEVGKTIVFDLFPNEVGGGYFYDFTRTWCLGYAPEEVEALYTDVLEVYQQIYSELTLERPCREFQIMTCEQFEARGHPTVLGTPKTQQGYVHSLAHGVGLAVHEGPSFSHLKGNQDRILPNTVFTFEPGLYYPERGIGIRLEDTVWARPDGTFETLVEFPMDLVIPLPGV